MRYVVLDSWRGIAALLVALFHFNVASVFSFNALTRHAFLFVDFFFVLSGFVISYAYAGRIGSGPALSAFMLRRLGRVYPAHVVVLGLLVAVELARLLVSLRVGQGTAFSQGFWPEAIALHLAFLQIFDPVYVQSWNVPSWSIAAEVWTYLIFGVVCLVAKRWTTVALATLGAISAAVLITRSDVGIGVIDRLAVFRCVYGFAVGHLVWRAHRSLAVSDQSTATTMEVLAVAAIGLFVISAGHGALSFAAPIVFALAVGIFAQQAGGVSKWLTRPAFTRLGDLSYGIYIVHIFFVTLLNLAVAQIEKRAGLSLRFANPGDVTMTEVVRFETPGAGELATVIYLGVIVLAAVMLRRFVELPASAAINALASSGVARRA